MWVRVPLCEGDALVEQYTVENTAELDSNKSAIGNFGVQGNTITGHFTSSEAVSADIVFMLASAYFDEDVRGNVATHDLQNKIRIEINGVAVRLDQLVLEVDSPINYYDWKAVTVSGCMLQEGENVLTIEALAYGAPNMDVLYVYAGGAGLLPVEAENGKRRELFAGLHLRCS